MSFPSYGGLQIVGDLGPEIHINAMHTLARNHIAYHLALDIHDDLITVLSAQSGRGPRDKIILCAAHQNDLTEVLERA